MMPAHLVGRCNCKLAAVGNADSWTAGNYSDPAMLPKSIPPAMLPMAPLISSTTVSRVIRWSDSSSVAVTDRIRDRAGSDSAAAPNYHQNGSSPPNIPHHQIFTTDWTGHQYQNCQHTSRLLSDFLLAS